MKCKAVIFGGTTEGRALMEASVGYEIPIVYCVATEDGARAAAEIPDGVQVHIGRLDSMEMVSLFAQHMPALVIDATHPYAKEAHQNIKAACGQACISLLCVKRDSAEREGCVSFGGIEYLIPWLKNEPGVIFSTAGASLAKALLALPDYQSRIWMRILPSTESLRTCLDLGYRPERIICMQGPFSREINRAMFANANARILVTKDSGVPGGFSEKVCAAQSLSMITAVLERREKAVGVSLGEAIKRMMELCR